MHLKKRPVDLDQPPHGPGVHAVMVKIVLRPIPVAFACRGCEREAAARTVAAHLDRAGLAEASVAGSDSAKARSRFPVYAIEGCGKCCAAQWLAGHGVKPQRSFVLDPAGELAPQLDAIAAELT
jgi:uncharacterized metal-binding protein